MAGERRDELDHNISKVRLYKAPWYETEKYWPAITEWLDRALKHGRFAYSNEDVFTRVMMREATLWLALNADKVRGFAVTSIEEMPQARYLTILLVGGRGFKDWECLIPGLEDEAARLGCDQICAIGRRGWERMAAKSGMKPYAVVYRKDIHHERRQRRGGLDEQRHHSTNPGGSRGTGAVGAAATPPDTRL